MTLHGLSHGLAALVCTISSGVLISMGADHYPAFTVQLEKVGQEIAALVQFDTSGKTIAILMISFVLAIVWGAAFSFLHSDH